MSSNNPNLYVVIMAGGGGLRLWPASKRSQPKQFLDLLGNGQTLLQSTYSRAKCFVDNERIIVVTAQEYAQLVAEQLPALPQENILGEPCKRNTAPCLALANAWIRARDPKAFMLVLSSDHHIPDLNAFTNCITDGLAFCRTQPEALLTIGLHPTRPETGYGYIETHTVESAGVAKVSCFREKPDLETAKRYVADGNHLWNSGIFLWSTSALAQAIERFLPLVHKAFIPLVNASNIESHNIEKIYAACPEISIDNGILERSESVYVLRGTFEWSDLGTWSAIGRYMPHDTLQNATVGNIFTHDVQQCIIHSDADRLLALVGLEGFTVAWHDNTLLICPTEREQEIRQVVKEIETKFGETFL